MFKTNNIKTWSKIRITVISNLLQISLLTNFPYRSIIINIYIFLLFLICFMDLWDCSYIINLGVTAIFQDIYIFRICVHLLFLLTNWSFLFSNLGDGERQLENKGLKKAKTLRSCHTRQLRRIKQCVLFILIFNSVVQLWQSHFLRLLWLW